MFEAGNSFVRMLNTEQSPWLCKFQFEGDANGIRQVQWNLLDSSHVNLGKCLWKAFGGKKAGGVKTRKGMRRSVDHTETVICCCLRWCFQVHIRAGEYRAKTTLSHREKRFQSRYPWTNNPANFVAANDQLSVVSTFFPLWCQSRLAQSLQCLTTLPPPLQSWLVVECTDFTAV